MLTENDINFIKSNRKEITQGRTIPIKLLYTFESAVDEWTGEVIAETVEHEVEAVVKEIEGGESDFSVIAGAIEDRSDLQLSINFDQTFEFVNERPHRLIYADSTYSIQTVDRFGIGHHNRLEITARKVDV